jgi:hypothetical protein
MKKKYDSFATVDIILLPLTKDLNWVLVKDTINDAIICRKPINYIKMIGLDLKVPYKAELGIYTNERGYLEYDFLKGKIYSYNLVQQVESVPVKKSEKPSKTSANKPAWLK